MSEKKDLSIVMKGYGRLNIRVCALIQKGDKFLCELGYNSEFFVLPGGRVTFFESAEDAVVREVKEELNINIKVERCLFVHQNFFDWVPGQKCHEIAFYFLVSTDDELSDCTFHNLDGSSTFSWKTAEEIKNTKFFPLYLQKCIDNLPQTTQFVCERE